MVLYSGVLEVSLPRLSYYDPSTDQRVKFLHKAHRVCSPSDYHKAATPILKTLTRDESGRFRDIRPGESAKSVYDDVTDPKTRFIFHTSHGNVTEDMPRHLQYREADALEDAVLFPDENDGMDEPRKRFKTIRSQLTKYTERGPTDDFIQRFAQDIDTDEELEDYVDEDDGSEWETEDSDTCEPESEDGYEYVLEGEEEKEDEENDAKSKGNQLA